jgi:hypothetical protein
MPNEPAFGLEYDPYGFDRDAKEAGRRELAPSSNVDMAVGALNAYLEERVGGRSCLIAGARGSGKTTLIDRAFHEVKSKGYFRCRPIRVRLHGPSLLKPPRPTPTAANPDPPPISVDEHVLKTLMINLYQTAAEEVAEAFKEYLGSNRREDLEFGAQLRLTLDGAPSAATLRFFWDRVGALSSGVLFREFWPRPEERQHSDTWAPWNGQGAAEIVALASAADAYRTCTGQSSKEKKDEESRGEKTETKTELSASGKELSKAFTGLVAGVAAGATAGLLGEGKAASALAGAVIALASIITINYTRTRSRETTLKEEVTFLPDTTVSGLVHRVLLLLRRLRQAGLAPIFVIDELDKVPNPVEPLNKLTASLKFLFADEGFFCFLTDRTYFAEIGQMNRQQANIPLRTIYTDQMLVRYETSEIRQFLSKVIRPYGTTDVTIRQDLEADAEAFRYIMICRSRMLMFELSRDLAGFISSNNKLKFPFKALSKNPGHQFHLAIQLAIELVLTKEHVANRISRDANFAQTIYDALYYPVNLWYADERDVNCSRDALIKGIGELTGGPLKLELKDQEFLHTQVTAMLELLVDLKSFKDLLRAAFQSQRLVVAKDILGRMVDAIPQEFQLLKVTSEVDDIYRWNYNRSGIPYDASTIQDIQDSRALWDAYSIIVQLEKWVAELACLRPTVEETLSGLSAATSVIESLIALSIPIGVNE